MTPCPPWIRSLGLCLPLLFLICPLFAQDSNPEATTPSEAHEDDDFKLEERITRHWSWRPIKNLAPPAVSRKDWPREYLDRYILARQEAAGLTPGPDAAPAIWLRRVHFALVGLPPSPEEVAAFVRDPSEASRAAVVDRLLASEDFGEHWARAWLDLVRYAETYGHEFDYRIPHAHEYRDYVIRALNADLPYDDFMREHIAGDLLAAPRRHPEEGFNESIIGTGFWHFGQATHGPVDVRQDEADRVANQIDVMSKTFLGLTVACARCHDHKFDAIPTTDYYALAGYLQSSRRVEEHLDPQGKIADAARRVEAELEPVRRFWERAELPPKMAEELGAAASLKKRQGAPLVHEAEALEVEVEGGAWVRQELGSNYSEGHHQWWHGAEIGQSLKIRLPQTSRGGRHVVSAYMTRAPDYGIVQWYWGEQKLGPPQNLYAAKVERTERITLGTVLMETKAPPQLRVRIVGHDPRAVPAHMFGLDTLHLERAPDAKTIVNFRRSVAESGLDFDRIQRWANFLSEESLEDRWRRIDSGEVEPIFSADSLAMVPDSQRTGAGFRAGSWDRLSIDIETGAPEPRPAFSSRVLGRRFEGELRSESFVIPEGGLSYRVAGEKARIRVIIDGFVMDRFNALLFKGVSFPIETEGRWTWIHQTGDIERYVGHRAHIEFEDAGEGWIAVDSVLPGAPPKLKPNQRRWYCLKRLKRLVNEVEAQRLPNLFASEVRLAAPRLAQVAHEVWRTKHRAPLAAALLRHGLIELDDEARAALARARAIAAEVPRPRRVLAMRDGTAENERVFIRGNHRSPGPLVPRRPPLAMCRTASDRVPPRTGSGRLELAEVLLDRRNPFPARVIVNRVWQHLFGRGLIASPDDFGELGEAPSHPELLDHLASSLRDRDRWSLKALIRRLVLSRSFGLSSRISSEEAERRDPNNLLLHRARLRRLTGEALRDAMLKVSGRLDSQRYGPSVPTHLTPFMQGRGRPRSGPVDGEGRRSIYLATNRNFLSPFFLAFDAPQPSTTTGRRSVSNVPAQSLALMNSELSHALAQHWAERIASEFKGPTAQVTRMYREAFARAPEAAELVLALDFLDREEAGGEAPTAALKDLAQSLFNVKTFAWIR
jgi:Protein of unknown function (DUF1553)/Protein of unknown function (DUF1549)